MVVGVVCIGLHCGECVRLCLESIGWALVGLACVGLDWCTSVVLGLSCIGMVWSGFPFIFKDFHGFAWILMDFH